MKSSGYFYQNKPGFNQPIPKKSNFFRLIALVLLAGLIIGLLYSYSQYNNYTLFAKGMEDEAREGDTTVFEVKEGENLDEIVGRMTELGLLPEVTVFGSEAHKLYFKVHSVDTTTIRPGVYEVAYNQEPKVLLRSLRHEGCEEVQITIREGLRIEEIAEVVESKLAGTRDAQFSSKEFVNKAKEYNKPADLNLSFAPPTYLEGFLFPDTYRICSDITTEKLISLFLQTFDRKVYSAFKDEIVSSNLSLVEIMNMASLLEREARGLEEKQMIADIIHRRMKANMVLGIDATTQYQFGEPGNWWIRGQELAAVIDTQHEYSTRKQQGLPPTPIANPGVNSVKAVLEPMPNEYYYYITGNDGNMYYAKTNQEHIYNICKYINEKCL